MRLFGLVNLARSLKIPFPNIPLNTDNTDKMFADFKEVLIAEAKKQGFGKYIKNK
jgi:hypothetical protein